MRKILIICTIIASFFSFPSYAEEVKASRESIENLLKITNTEKLIENYTQQFDSIIASFKNKKPLSQADKDIMAEIKKELQWSKLKEPYIDLYMSLFNEKEITAMTQFYQSPEGHSILEKMPELMKKSSEISMKMMVDLMPKIENILKQTEENKQ